MQKRDRQKKIESIIIKDNHGWRQASLARKLGVHRSTIGRDIKEMVTRIPIYEKNDLIYINSAAYQSRLSLTLHEVLSLHMLLQSMETQREGVVDGHLLSIERKVYNSMKDFAPDLVSSFNTQQKGSSGSVKAMKAVERIHQAWIEQRKVSLSYKRDGRKYNVKGAVCHLERDFYSGELNLLFMEGKNIGCLVLDAASIDSVRLLSEEVIMPERDTLEKHIQKCKEKQIKSSV